MFEGRKEARVAKLEKPRARVVRDETERQWRLSHEGLFKPW